MVKRILCSVIAVIAASILAGCIAIPVPLPRRGDIYTTEQKIEDLVNNGASKAEVFEQLGNPHRCNKTSMIYKACREPFGIEMILVAAGGMGADFEEFRGETKCFELLLDFDQNNILSGYQEIPWQEDFDYTQAQLLYQQYLSRSPDDSSGITFLCRAADQGHPNAQIEVGRHFAQGNYGLQKDLKRAYVWYSLASSCVLSMHLRLLSQKMTSEQIAEAKIMLKDWKPGQCEHDLIPAVFGN